MAYGDQELASGQQATHDFLISRSRLDDHYGVWKFDTNAPELLTEVPLGPEAQFDNTRNLVAIGGYLLDWGANRNCGRTPGYPFRLFRFDPSSRDPLVAPALQKGVWPSTKFHCPAELGGIDGGGEDGLQLLSTSSFLLSFQASQAQSAVQLWNFDPRSTRAGRADPLPTPYSPPGTLSTIGSGHRLIAMGNYVLDWTPATGDYRLLSFDPQLAMPLAEPPVQTGNWHSILDNHRLVPIGEWLLDWVPRDLSYRLWRFDPESPQLLCGPVGQGRLPSTFSAHTSLASVQPTIPVQEAYRDTPGTIDYMRTRIKHVVYCIMEGHSFDSVCGWLYENGEDEIHFVGADEAFRGANTDFSDDEGVSEEELGKFSPDRLPVLTGLARHFGVSDEWFSSAPEGSGNNRAGSLTGSTLHAPRASRAGAKAKDGSMRAHRQPIWKVLWTSGFTDWRIYSGMQPADRGAAYDHYLVGQIPTVDADSSGHVANMERFTQDAGSGDLPAFSYLELSAAGVGSAEEALNGVYEALRHGPGWDDTVLVVTFDENKGLYDHVPPPQARKAWPNDVSDGFNHDLMGPRVPTIAVSPWIMEQTVFRADGDVPFDATSFLATLLSWYGIPKARWGLGDRTHQAPTFESVFLSTWPREDAPVLAPNLAK